MKTLALVAAIALWAINVATAKYDMLEFESEQFFADLSKSDQGLTIRFLKLVERIYSDTARGIDLTDAFYDELAKDVSHYYKPRTFKIGAGNAFNYAIDRPCEIMKKANKSIEQLRDAIRSDWIKKGVEVCGLYKKLGTLTVKWKLNKRLYGDFNEQRYYKSYFDSKARQHSKQKNYRQI